MYTIISSVISALTAIFVCLISQISMSRKQTAEIEKQTALIDLRLTTLTEDVKKHNSVIERTYHLEKTCAVIKERIDNLEEKVGK